MSSGFSTRLLRVAADDQRPLAHARPSRTPPPVMSAYMNPAHAASTSIAGPISPSRSCTRHAVEGNDMSGVNVPSTSRSQSFAVAAGLGEEVAGGLDAQVGRGLVRGGVAAFEDAGALDDPVGVEAEAGVEVVVADDHVRHVLPGADDPDAHEGPAFRPGRWSFAAHRFGIRHGTRAGHAGSAVGGDYMNGGSGEWAVGSGQ